MARFDPRGKVAWVTGASSGIGSALAVLLAKAGAKVAITARRANLLDDLAAPLSAAGQQVLVVPGDTTDRAAMHQVVARIKDTWGPVDIAVLNAGINLPHSGKNFRAEVLESIIRANLFGPANCIEALLPDMVARRSGFLVAVASLVAYRPLPVAPAYGTSKVALQYLMDSLRFSLEPLGITVSVANPGFVRTPMVDGLKQPMPGIVSAEVAASRILAGIVRRQREIAFPRRLSWPLRLLRIVPYGAYHRMVGRAVKP